jgi:Tat protein translocase TatC
LSEEQEKMTFLEHLEELRTRLIRCALAVVGGMVICWFFREDIRSFLEAPLYEAWRSVEGLPEPEPLKFKSLLEPFIAYLKLSAVGGIFLAAPVILYNLWKFVSPGLYQKEKKVALPFVFVSTVLFVGGSTMAYSIVFPIGFSFFLDFAAGGAVEHYEASVEIAKVDQVEARVEDSEEPAVPRGARIEPAAGATGATDAGARGDGPLGEDAGVPDDGPDAGVDGGVSVSRGPPEPEAGGEVFDERSPPRRAGDDQAEEGPGPGEDREAWWEIVMHRFLMEDCGKFEVDDNRDGTVTLRYDWDLERCEERPDISRLVRGDEELDLEWKEIETDDGRLVLEAVDRISTTGEIDYRLSALLDPRAEGKLAPMLMVQDYLSFAVRLLLAFGIVFELPILITFLALAGIVNYRQLLKFSRWFVVLAVVFSAMLTPPDIVTQVLLAMPLTVLYFLSILVAYIFGPKPDE